jgi:nickel-dependent lactate racemase
MPPSEPFLPGPGLVEPIVPGEGTHTQPGHPLLVDYPLLEVDEARSRPLIALGSPTADIEATKLAEALETLAGHVRAGDVRRVLLVPPDRTRLASRAGAITTVLRRLLLRDGMKVDVMPALGTHRAMDDADCDAMFGGEIGAPELLVHRWREDVVRLGTARAAGHEVPVEVNRALIDESYDLVMPIGQVVPHEVAGFAGFTKMVCIGLGGTDAIGSSHLISALHGIERTMGVVQTPVRTLLDTGFDELIDERCRVLWVMTVVEGTPDGGVLRGLFSGEGGSGASGGDAFRAAASLSAIVNIVPVADPISRCVVVLDEHEYRSAWLANKAIYRTRMALAEGADLFVVAPGVSRFGEDDTIDALIRRHGYRGTEATLAAMDADPGLRASPGAAAHLIHGSSEGRFSITYSPSQQLSRTEVEGVGFRYLSPADAARRFGLANAPSGVCSDIDGQPFTLIRQPGLGLWRTAS